MTQQIETKSKDNSETLLRVENLTKRFRGLVAVDGLDFSVERGEIRALIGPNGAGKSTFLKLLVGDLTPSDGRILFDDEEIMGLDSYERNRRGLSMKYQTPSLYLNLSVEENLYIALQRHTARDEIRNEIDRILPEFHLEGDRDSTVNNLAHGQQQWLEIAMALSTDPSLLLLDEPTAGMTIEETKETAELIHRINQEESVTFIVVEHDIDFVREIAREETVTVLHRGSVFAEGSIEEIEQDEDVQRIYLGES